MSTVACDQPDRANIIKVPLEKLFPERDFSDDEIEDLLDKEKSLFHPAIIEYAKSKGVRHGDFLCIRTEDDDDSVYTLYHEEKGILKIEDWNNTFIVPEDFIVDQISFGPFYWKDVYENRDDLFLSFRVPKDLLDRSKEDLKISPNGKYYESLIILGNKKYYLLVSSEVYSDMDEVWLDTFTDVYLSHLGIPYKKEHCVFVMHKLF